MSLYSYDAAGNMTNDGVHSYTYDAEDNVTQVDGGQTATYTYDALNRRVRIDGGGSSFEFIFDPQGRHSSEWDANNKWEEEGWTYWGASPISFYTNGTTQFEHQDWQGTERARTDVNGNSAGTYFSLPFGDGYSYTDTDWNPYHFGTLDQDNSANEHAQFREYSNMAGRWFSPDPYQGSYDPNNPQSFNRYAYVLNSPLSFIDPAGLGPGDCFLTGLSGNTCSVTVSGNPPGGPGGPSDGSVGIPLIFKGGQHGQGGPGTAPSNGGLLHRAICGAFSWLTGAASATNSTIGIGGGGNGGVGFILGIAASGGVQVVADSSGNLGVAITVGGNPGYGVFGVGAMGGVQGSVSTAGTIYGLRGGSVDAGASFGAGPAVTLDGSAAMDGSSFTGTVTVGPGVGTKGTALGVDYTWVPSALSTNCH